MENKIWLTSDLHFNHDKEFLYKPRGFDTVFQMNFAIIENWNWVVHPEDDVYVLGDLMLGDLGTAIKMLKQLKGKIHIVRGNHDGDFRMEMYHNCYNVVEITEGQFLKYQGYNFYLSHYPCICSNWDFDKPLKARTISLCGHCHTTDKFKDWDKGLIYHVELDAHNNEPVLIDNIIEDIKEKMKNE